MRILIVEDSYSLADTLETAFKKEHFLVDKVYDGVDGYEYAKTGIYDIVILDLMLPKLNGYEIIKKLRDEGNPIPILILSAKSELEDKVEGFKNGADDYLTKPFEIKELIMRINAIVKRNCNSQTKNLICGDMILDLSTCEMRNSNTNKSIRVSGKEFQMLEMLMYNQNQVITKEQITEKIWGYNSNAEYNNVEVYVSFLRRKIKQLSCNVTINSIRGVGYSLEG